MMSRLFFAGLFVVAAVVAVAYHGCDPVTSAKVPAGVDSTAIKDSIARADSVAVVNRAAAEAFRITTQVPGWVDIDTMYHAFTIDEMFALYDGQAIIFGDKGMINGIRGYLYNGPVGPTQKTVEFTAANFGTAAKATGMFSYKVDSVGTTLKKVVIPPYADTMMVVGKMTSTLCTVYAHVNNFYFSIAVHGPSESVEIADASLFMQAIMAKVK